MLDFLNIFIPILLPCLVVAAGVIGLLVLCSIGLRSKPWIGFLVIPIVNSVLFGGCPALLILTDMVHNRRYYGSPLTSFFWKNYWYGFYLWGLPPTLLGVIVGLMACAGTFLWRGATYSRSRAVLGLLLVSLSWIILGLGLAAQVFMFFVGAVGAGQ